MLGDPTKIASGIAAAYVLVVGGGILLHFAGSGDLGSLKYSLSLPSTWAAIATGAVLSWGLWHRFRWAWVLGLVAVAIQLVRVLALLVHGFNLQKPPGVGVILVLVLLVAFLVVLLLPGTRAACTR